MHFTVIFPKGQRKIDPNRDIGGRYRMNRRFCSAAIAVFILLLSGCRPTANQPIAGKLITDITITCQTCVDVTRRYYNTNEKMQLILLYIRDLGPRFKTKDDPESISGREISITMRCVDGTKKVYRQKNDRYFQAGLEEWTQIDPERGSALWRIVLHTPGDPEPPSAQRQQLPSYKRKHPG